MDLSVIGTFIGYFLIIAGQFVILKMDRVADKKDIISIKEAIVEIKSDIRYSDKKIQDLRIALAEHGIKIITEER